MKPRGFTVIELLVVLAAVGLLLAVAAPRYMKHVDLAREVALRQNLWHLRDAIDKFRADTGRYPAALDELVTRHYLRAVPEDPLTRRHDSWLAVPAGATTAGDPTQRVQSVDGAGIYDVRSGASGRSSDGTAYADW